MFESLETRRLFAITFSNGVLTIEGNKKDEILGVTIDTVLTDTCIAQIQRNLEVVGKKTFKASKVDLIKIFGKGGIDTCQVLAMYNGTAPDAKLFGGAGVDSLVGSTGNDTIVGGPGEDNCNGNGGNDLMKGNGGQDALDGKAGNDTIIGGAGEADRLYGGDGDDVLKAQDGKFDWLFDSSGDDTAYVDEEDNQTGGGDIETVITD